MSQKLKILILEDNLLDAELMESELKKGNIDFVSKKIETRKDFLLQLKNFEPDLILADYSLPAFTAKEALPLAKRHAPLSPFIIVTGTISEEVAVECMQMGASDYILKDSLTRLVPAIKRALENADTERENIQHEKLLKESEERFKLLFEEAPLAYQSLDENGHFLYVNQTWLDVLGYSRDDVIGSSFKILLPPEYHKVFDEKFLQFKAQGEVCAIQYEFIKKDGTRLFVEFNGKISYDQDGNFRQTHCIFQDVTEKKKAERDLKDYAERWSGTFNAMSDSICLLDTEMNILVCNDAAAKMFGKSKDEVIGKPCCFLIHGTKEPIEGCPVSRMKKSLKRETSEIMLGDQWFNIAADPILDEAGKVKGIVHVIANITQRKETEKALLQEKDFSDNAINSLPGVFYLFDDKGKFLRWNKNWEEISEYSAEEISKMSPIDFFEGDDKKIISEAIETVFKEGENTAEAHFVSKSGKSPLYYFTGKRMEIDHASYLVGSGIDISERKEAEQNLKGSEERYKALYNSSMDAIMLLTMQEGFFAGNPSCVKLFGCKSEEDFKNQDPASLSPEYQPDGKMSTEKAREMMQVAMDKGTHCFEWVHKKMTGEEFLATVLLTKVEGEKEVFLQATVRDITEQRKAQEDIAFLAKFPEEDPSPVLRISEGGDILYENNSGRRMIDVCGYRKGDKLLGELYDEGIKKAFLEKSNQVMEVNSGDQIYSCTITPIVEGGYANVYAQDITDRKKTYEKLRVASAEWERTFNSITDLIFIQDMDSTIVKANEAFLKVMNLKEEDVIGKKCYELLHKRSSPWPNCPFEKTKKDSKVHTEEVDDEEIGIPLLITTSPIFDDRGILIGSVHISKDISKQREDQKETKKRIHDLETIYKASMGREEKILDLKKEIAALNKKFGPSADK